MIKNWKLTLLAWFFVAVFVSLGVWQVKRAEYKKNLLQVFLHKEKQAPLAFKELSSQKDIRFQLIQLTGHYDNQHSILLDNKIYQKRVGYELYTPFHIDGFDQIFLIDRGFIPILKSRAETPIIPAVEQEISLTGLINIAPRYVAFGKMTYSKNWPLRVEYLDLEKLAPYFSKKLFPYVIQIQPKTVSAYPIEWQINIMPPEKHQAYAVQWFALALTLLIISLALNRTKTKNENARMRNET